LLRIEFGSEMALEFYKFIKKHQAIAW
jgi:hypothetical protein